MDVPSDVEQAGGARYAAFISYSHKDAAFGRWLHRRLEGYRLPRRLAGRDGERGPVPARLTPIFRDRDELPAAGDLSERVRAALTISGALIVICSPNSAASPWVGKEIATFRQLHPDRPIFAAIAEGEPHQCFPPELRQGNAGEIEPLAADFRKAGDGHRLGILKLVSGIAGIGLDQLVQRDAQRRIRRVTAVTLAALMGMLVTATMAIVAINARAEAQRQRAEAEGLVEFMLTDLRDRLKGVGRLDVLTAVNQRALSYYGTKSGLNSLPEDSLARRAHIFEVMGEDDLDRDDYPEALSAFVEAGRTTSELLAREPHNPRRILDHARSLGGIGRVYEGQEEWSSARRYYSSVANLARQLLRIDSKNSDYLARAGSAELDIGNIEFRDLKDYPAAARSYGRAVAFFENAQRLDPDNFHYMISRANSLGWLADSFYYRHLWQQSLRHRRAQFDIMSGLHDAHECDRDVSYYFIAAERGLAYSLLATESQTKALYYIASALRQSESLVTVDRENAKWSSLRAQLLKDFARKDVNPAGMSVEMIIPNQTEKPECEKPDNSSHMPNNTPPTEANGGRR